MGGPGKLLVCATPIGNMGDVTLRVLDALRDADLVAAEDTRVTRRLLARYDIRTPLERYDEHTAEERTPHLIARITRGEAVALVSDAGTPGISDPGSRLVSACLDAGLCVEVLPGPSAIVTALVASGLPTHAFFFGGFLPRKSGARRRRLEDLAGLDATLVFYESPRRTAAALAHIAEVFPGRPAAVARELTKLHEEVARGETGELARSFAERELKGEVVLLVGPPSGQAARAARPTLGPDELRRLVQAAIDAGSSRKEAIAQVARDTGMPRRAVYEAAHGDARQ